MIKVIENTCDLLDFMFYKLAKKEHKTALDIKEMNWIADERKIMLIRTLIYKKEKSIEKE